MKRPPLISSSARRQVLQNCLHTHAVPANMVNIRVILRCNLLLANYLGSFVLTGFCFVLCCVDVFWSGFEHGSLGRGEVCKLSIAIQSHAKPLEPGFPGGQFLGVIIFLFQFGKVLFVIVYAICVSGNSCQAGGTLI